MLLIDPAKMSANKVEKADAGYSIQSISQSVSQSVSEWLFSPGAGYESYYLGKIVDHMKAFSFRNKHPITRRLPEC